MMDQRREFVALVAEPVTIRLLKKYCTKRLEDHAIFLQVFRLYVIRLYVIRLLRRCLLCLRGQCEGSPTHISPSVDRHGKLRRRACREAVRSDEISRLPAGIIVATGI